METNDVISANAVTCCVCAQVHRVFTKGAASLEGTIQRGDSILSINGSSLEGKTHGEAVSCLHQARLSSLASVIIRRDRGQTEDQAEQPKRSSSNRRRSSGAGAGGTQVLDCTRESASLFCVISRLTVCYALPSPKKVPPKKKRSIQPPSTS